MEKLSSLKIAGWLMALNALAHLVGSVLGGFSGPATILFVVGVLYGAIAYGLMRGWRWLAYFTFIFALFGSIYAFSAMGVGALGAGGVPNWVYLGIMVIDLVVMVVLFLNIWRRR